ncbi:hypothetical protein TVAG_261480 [Trichomonas vaginalis G3]|uniref:RGS domain-containing protein n=1 Tax=Trichomonas vaginalis (strain ATCC PRA-98 / G3) TaxID=412133 RepID=A2GE38_TRIV3|nr:regulator of G-protein signaling, RGS family [Trichomonas vaginalis G3]EAX84579.1 hypothetical protein TVAG_261480 [Trichomonas vaginalis G3]KAI5496594.1 regulator of G-protein signaling, RGS family [Trichomonas vaginalis G3]|eukprot:XP_001297509.1 hypothetical protein [Trichomonas vaginalis G3]
MDCIALAQRLANKGPRTQAPIAPVQNRFSAKRVTQKAENQDANGSDGKKAHFDSNDSAHYIPPIEEIFTDENLMRYFKRFLTERKTEGVIEFIEYAREYKANYPPNPQKQVKVHRLVMEKLGSLPSNFIKIATSAHEDMNRVGRSSFDKVNKLLLDALNEKEYKAFLKCPYFSKWILKYHNVDQ